MNRTRARTLLFAATLTLSLVLTITPLPTMLTPFKPYWPALALLYWALESNDCVSLGLAASVGLAADLLAGVLLGEQALRLLVMVFIALRFRSRLHFFPMWRQSLAVLALLLNDRILQLTVRTLAGEAVPPLVYWAAPLVGALRWPCVFLLLDTLRARLLVHNI